MNPTGIREQETEPTSRSFHPEKIPYVYANDYTIHMRFFRFLLFLSVTSLFSCHHKPAYPFVTTLAGSGRMSFQDGKGMQASFANLMGITCDRSGNIFVADSHNNLIRKITPDGTVSTFAGNGKQGSADGTGPAASFFNPEGIASDSQGNLYVADTHNNLVRRISPEGRVTTLAGLRKSGTLPTQKDTLPPLDNPSGIAVDASGNVYIADWGNDLIRKLTPDGKLTVFAGTGDRGNTNGPAGKATFYLPAGLALDDAGNLYVADSYNNMIRKISPAGWVSLVAGQPEKGCADGKGTSAAFYHPTGIAIGKNGRIYVADMGNNRIRVVTMEGQVSTLAGTGRRGNAGGPGAQAAFFQPFALATDPNDNLYIADYQNNQVKEISSPAEGSPGKKPQ